MIKKSLKIKDRYKEWLRGHLLNRGEIVYCHDWLFPEDDYFVAKEDFRLYDVGFPMFIIVPAGIKHLGKNMFENKLLFMDEYKGEAILYFDINFDDENNEELNILLSRRRETERQRDPEYMSNLYFAELRKNREELLKKMEGGLK